MYQPAWASLPWITSFLIIPPTWSRRLRILDLALRICLQKKDEGCCMSAFVQAQNPTLCFLMIMDSNRLSKCITTVKKLELACSKPQHVNLNYWIMALVRYNTWWKYSWAYWPHWQPHLTYRVWSPVSSIKLSFFALAFFSAAWRRSTLNDNKIIALELQIQ